MNLREAAQQALEALMWHDEGMRTRADSEAIAALRSALAQQEEGRMEFNVKETVCHTCGSTNGAHSHDCPVAKAALEQQEQEPVAWIQPDHLQKARRAPFLCRVEPTKRMSDFVAVYTHPPRREWVSLTDTEIGMEYVKWDATPGASMADFARAIEAALKEKNHE